MVDRNLSWLALVLLLIAYGNFGWLLASFQQDNFDRFDPKEHGPVGWLVSILGLPWILWIGAALLVVVLALFLTSMMSGPKNIVVRLFQSDASIFAFVAAIAFFSVLIVAWIHFFAQLLVLLAAEILARLEIQGLKFREWQAFSLLTLTSMTGLGIGIAGYYFLNV